MTSASVRAWNHWTRNPILLQDGEYEFRADGCWADLIIPCGPDGYPTPCWSWLQRQLTGWRRAPAANWLALCGAVRRPGAKNHVFVIGKASHHTLPEGKLYCFANDVYGFYWNNFGSVMVTMRKLS